MPDEKLLVDQKDVNQLWNEYCGWQNCKGVGDWGKGYKCGIGHVLMALGLNREDKTDGRT